MASKRVKVDVKFDIEPLIDKFETIFDDDKFKLAVNNTLARYCDPYVPFLNSPLSTTIEVTTEGVSYIQPYARYQYYGEIYGPNIPIKQDGEIVGWFSPKGKPKHPTGRKMNYTKDFHPLATSKWDEAMMRDRGEEFCEEVKRLVNWRAKELYG